MVRVELHGRRVGGWITEVDPDYDPSLELKPLTKLVGHGPDASVLELAEWAAWRWSGKRAQFMRTASPARVVKQLPESLAAVPADVRAEEVGETSWFGEALGNGGGVVRVPPAGDRWPVILAAVALGNPLIVAPARATVQALADRLGVAGIPVAVMPDGWAQAAAGCAVVGTRAAAFAPLRNCGAIVVLDEHDEGLVEERAPTWNARDVLIERARRLGIPCVLLSPHPSLEAQRWRTPTIPPRPLEREGWPRLEVIDRRAEPPGSGVFSAGLVRLIRESQRAVCVLNRKGRSGLLACNGCGELAHCTDCGAALVQLEATELTCRRCGAVRPVVCPSCGSTRFKNLRMGVDRVRSDLETLLRRPVAEVTASGWLAGGPESEVVVGTEAALHQVPRCDLVAFLEFDQEVVAPRYRAVEQSLALLSKACRMVGPRARRGIVAVQTRLPEHPLFDSVATAHPDRLDAEALAVRTQLGMPPMTALALVEGEAAATWVNAVGSNPGIEVLGPTDGRWLLRAGDHESLCDAIAATARPTGRLRVSVDPLRV